MSRYFFAFTKLESALYDVDFSKEQGKYFQKSEAYNCLLLRSPALFENF